MCFADIYKVAEEIILLLKKVFSSEKQEFWSDEKWKNELSAQVCINTHLFFLPILACIGEGIIGIRVKLMLKHVSIDT